MIILLNFFNKNLFSLFRFNPLFSYQKKSSFHLKLIFNHVTKKKRGDRNELNSLSDRAIIKLQSPTRSTGSKFSSVPAFVSVVSTPEPFSFKPTSSATQRTFRPSSSIPSTTPSTTTTTQRTTEYQFVTTRYRIRSQIRKFSVDYVVVVSASLVAS